MVVRRYHARQKEMFLVLIIQLTFKPLCVMIFCQISHHSAAFNRDEMKHIEKQDNPLHA